MSSFTLPGPDIATNGGTSLSHPGSSTESLPTVVIGCMERLEEYQTLLTKLWEVEGKEKVRGEMVDRIVQNGQLQIMTSTLSGPQRRELNQLILLHTDVTATQLPAQLHQIHMLISTTQSIPFLPYVPKSTLVHFHPSASESSSSSSFTSNLEAQGWIPVAGAISHLPSGASSDQILSFTSPSTQTPLMPSSSTSQAVGGTVKLKKKSKAAKSSIWAAHSPMIEDPEKLLTAEDKKRPECVFPDPADGQRKRRKRACKDCTCGLKELEDEEFGTPSTPAFFIEGDDDIPDVIKNATAGVEKIWPKGDKLETAVKTSSCGSCYAGDAFRCGSCPYLGLPAFEPGQKIEIPVAMNDL